MSKKSDLSKQNLSVVIVTLKSEHVIHECIESIYKYIDVPINIIDGLLKG